MNAIFFAARRGDLAILAYARRLLAPHGLTPARFDMLYTLYDASSARDQTEIRGMLGVSAPVVSRMLRSLHELGLVHRFRVGRYRYAELTRLGRAVMRGAIVHVKKPADRDVPGRLGAAERGLVDVFITMEEPGLCFQTAFRHEARLLYPYLHPDD